MRYFQWIEMGLSSEPLILSCTDEEIIENYYPHWCDLMRAANKTHLINKENCIEDFMTVHWATEVEPPS